MYHVADVGLAVFALHTRSGLSLNVGRRQDKSTMILTSITVSLSWQQAGLIDFIWNSVLHQINSQLGCCLSLFAD